MIEFNRPPGDGLSDRSAPRLEPRLAQVIVDRSMDIVRCNVNVMNADGIIIASGDPRRLGTRHEGAALVSAQRTTVEVDAELARRLEGVQPGINLPLRAEGAIVGCVGLTGDPNELRRYGELVRMAAEAMLEQERLLRLVAHDARLREEIVLGLIREEPLPAPLLDWARRLNIDVEVPRVAVVVEVDSGALGSGDVLTELQRLHTLLAAPDRASLIATVSINELVVLRPALNGRGEWDSRVQRERLGRLHERVRRSGSLTVRLALGGYFAGPGGLARSYQVARTTLAVGRRRHPERGALFYEDLALRVLLDDLRRGWRAEELAKPLTTLKASDRQGQLVRTLSTWFANGMRMSATVRALRVHRNTLDYRIRRIEELTGLDLDETDDRMRLFLALHVAGEPTGSEAEATPIDPPA